MASFAEALGLPPGGLDIDPTELNAGTQVRHERADCLRYLRTHSRTVQATRLSWPGPKLQQALDSLRSQVAEQWEARPTPSAMPPALTAFAPGTTGSSTQCSTGGSRSM